MNNKNQVWGLADVSVCFLFLWSNTDQNQLGEERVHFSLQVTVSIMKASQAGDQGRSLEPGIKAETIKKCCLLACLACSVLQLRPTCPNMTPSTVGWLPYINQQARKGLQIYQRVSPSAEILSFQVCLSVYQVGKTTIFGVSTNHLCHLRTIDLNSEQNKDLWDQIKI